MYGEVATYLACAAAAAAAFVEPVAVCAWCSISIYPYGLCIVHVFHQIGAQMRAHRIDVFVQQCRLYVYWILYADTRASTPSPSNPSNNCSQMMTDRPTNRQSSAAKFGVPQNRLPSGLGARILMRIVYASRRSPRVDYVSELSERGECAADLSSTQRWF